MLDYILSLTTIIFSSGPLQQLQVYWPNYFKYSGLVDIAARLAQLVEQQTVMQQVLGSIPALDSTWLGVDSALHPSVGR